MKLAICDESTKFLNAFRVELYKLDPTISIVCYTSYEKLTTDFDIISFDAVIINTEIKSESGIDAAAVLVRKKPDTEIIFVTDKPERYSQLIFNHADIMRPFAFFVKPVSRTFMHHIINMLESSLKNNCNSNLVIKFSSHEIVTIRYAEIIYIEHNNRISYVHTDSDVIECRKSIQFFEETLPQAFFIHASKSVIVNASKVNFVRQNIVGLSGGETIYTSRNYRQKFINQIEQFSQMRKTSITPYFV